MTPLNVIKLSTKQGASDMRYVIVKNTKYKLFSRFTENGKKLLGIGKDVEENPYCWDSTFYNVVNMSWRRYKKYVSTHA